MQNENMSIESTLVVIFLTTLFATHASAQSSIPTEPTFFYQICDPSYGNYTAKSSYAANLKTVLTTLQNQSSITPFYNTSAGSVYGQYYCRFDIDSGNCSACISQASGLTGCPNFKSSVIFYDVCTLHYRNESMFGILDTSMGANGWSLTNVTDPASFSGLLNSTLDTLVKQAAYGNDFMKFAAADKAVSTFETAYFLVQCSPDLNPSECDSCLRETYQYINRCCGNWPARARVYFPSCQMRYSSFLFYTAPPSPPPMFSPSPPPIDFLPPPPSQ